MRIVYSAVLLAILAGCSSSDPVPRSLLPHGSPYVEAVAVLTNVSDGQARELAGFVRAVGWRCDSIYRARRYYLFSDANYLISCDSGARDYAIEWRQGIPFVCPGGECLRPGFLANMWPF